MHKLVTVKFLRLIIFSTSFFFQSSLEKTGIKKLLHVEFEILEFHQDVDLLKQERSTPIVNIANTYVGGISRNLVTIQKTKRR
jgi:hypothetical protein